MSYKKVVITVPNFVEEAKNYINSEDPTLNELSKVSTNASYKDYPFPMPLLSNKEKWKAFANSGGARYYDELFARDKCIDVSVNDLEDLGIDNKPNLDKEKRKKRRMIWYKKIHMALLNNPLVPLIFRAITWLLSLISLGLAASVLSSVLEEQVTAPLNNTFMAIITDSIALCYLVFVTYDEYTSKPIGLRSPLAKMRLIMLDMLFIVLNSANLSLALETIFEINCVSSSLIAIDDIGPTQRALAAFIFLSLVAWVASFAVSVFRLVERASGGRS